jgi:hypothetical protein
MKEILNSIYTEIIVKGLIVTVIGGSLLTYCNQNIDVLRTSYLVKNAEKKLITNDPDSIKSGVQNLLEIANEKPFRRQEMIDIIVKDLFRSHFGKESPQDEPTSKSMKDVFVDTLKSLLSIPRKDDNGHELNIDLHQMHLVSTDKNTIYMEKLNFEGVVLWGSDFEYVDFSRSSFENADIGGAYFKNCGMEDLNMNGAKISFSPLDERPTTIENSQLSRSNLEKADIYPGQNQLLIINSGIEQFKRELLKQRPGVEFK